MNMDKLKIFGQAAKEIIINVTPPFITTSVIKGINRTSQFIQDGGPAIKLMTAFYQDSKDILVKGAGFIMMKSASAYQNTISTASRIMSWRMSRQKLLPAPDAVNTPKRTFARRKRRKAFSGKLQTQ